MIYLIDDDLSVIRGTEVFLRSSDLEFKTFLRADDFLSSFTPAEGDIILLDLNLPGLSGYDLLKNFQLLDYHVPIIVITATDDPRNFAFCKEFGVKAFLRKPVDGDALLDLIKYNL